MSARAALVAGVVGFALGQVVVHLGHLNRLEGGQRREHHACSHDTVLKRIDHGPIQFTYVHPTTDEAKRQMLADLKRDLAFRRPRRQEERPPLVDEVRDSGLDVRDRAVGEVHGDFALLEVAHDSPSVETSPGVGSTARGVDDTVGARSDVDGVTPSAVASDAGPPQN